MFQGGGLTWCPRGPGFEPSTGRKEKKRKELDGGKAHGFTDMEAGSPGVKWLGLGPSARTTEDPS